MLLNRGDFRGHLYIVMDMLHCDLYAHLAEGGLKGLSMPDCKTLAIQLIQAMGYWQKLQIIHADIKPENVLLERSNSLDIRVIDFGSGAAVGKTLYQYIQSRYYRAPEVILGYEYDYSIDTWSMACVFYELFTGQPIFPGDDEFDQLGKICEVLGYPDPDYIKNAPRRNEFFWEAGPNRYMLRTNHKVGSRTLKNEMKGADDTYIELIESMIKWRPKERMTP